MTRRRSIATAVAVALALGAISLWLALPSVLKAALVWQLEGATGRDAEIESLDLSLRRGELRVDGVRVSARNSGPPLAVIDRVDVRFRVAPLWRGRIELDDAAITGIRIHVTRDERGQLSIADLLARPPAERPVAAAIHRLTLSDGALTIEDRAVAGGRTWQVDAIRAEASGLSTIQPDAAGTLTLTASAAGAPVSIGVTGLTLAPFAGDVRVDVRGVDATVAQLLLPPGAVVIERARLTAALNARMAPSGERRLDGQGRLEEVELREAARERALARTPSVAFQVDAEQDAQTAWVRRLEVTTAPTLSNHQVEPPSELALDRVELSVEGKDATSPARVTMTVALPGGGDVKVDGTARWSPLSAELRAVARRLDLAVWDAFLAATGRVSGVAEAEADIALAPSGEGTALRARGRASAIQPAVAEGDRPALRARRIDVTGIDVNWPRIAVARVAIAEPAVHAARDAEGRLSLAALLPPRAAGSPAAPPATPPKDGGAAAPSAIALEIGEIAVTNGSLELDDASVAPPARLRVAPVSASARGVTWPAARPAAVELDAAMPGGGSLNVDGTVTLDPVKWDLRARAAGVAIAPYQPYVPSPARIHGRLEADLAVTGGLAPALEAAARGTVAFADLALAEGGRPVITAGRVEAGGLEYRWPAALVVDRLHVERSSALIERRPDGTLPLRQLFRWPAAAAAAPPASKPDAEAGGAEVRVRQALLESGSVAFVDNSVAPAARVELAGVRLEATDFTWPIQGPSPLKLTAPMPGGGSVRAEGHLTGPAATVQLEVALADADLGLVRPYLPVRGRVGGRASAELQVTFALDPFSATARGKAGIADFALADDQRPLVAVPRVEATGLEYTWPAAVAIDRLDVERPSATVERRADGTLPLLALLGPPPPGRRARAVPAPAAATTPFEVRVREGVITGGAVTVVDAEVRPALRLELTDVSAEARDIAWPAQGSTAVEVAAVAPGGGRIGAQGDVAMSPLAADLRVTATGVDIAPLRALVPVRGALAGAAAADLAVKATWQPLAVTARGTVSVADLSLSEGDRRIASVRRAELAGLEYTWPAKLTADRLRVDGPWALVERNADGALTLSNLLETKPAPAPAKRAEPSKASATAIDVLVRQVMVEDAGATIADAFLKPASRVEIAGARVTGRNLAWPPRRDGRVHVVAATPGGGAIDVSGRMRLDGTRLDLRARLEQADLAVAAPYLPLRARVTGKMDADLTIRGTLSPLVVAVAGQVAVADAALSDGARTLATIKRLELGGVQADWPRRVALSRVLARDPWSLVERDAEGRFHLFSILGLLAPLATSEAVEAVGGTLDPEPGGPRTTAVDVGVLAIENGFVRFVDSTTRPRFVEELSGVALNAERLGTAPETRSRIRTTGQLGGGAAFEVEGMVGSLTGPLALDIEAKVTDLPLTRLNPYTSTYFGWSASRGALDLTAHYRVEDDRLDGVNELVLKQPEIVPSRRGEVARERIGVPLDMLISLLKSASGQVELTLPVTGVVSSRQFDFGDAVWEGVRKTVINVLALPVSWVGKIFYTADARIDTIQIWPVTFEPGTTELRRDIAAHAERLATFLRDAPGVSLTMRPVLSAADVRALAQAAVRQRIEALVQQSGEPAREVAARLYAERFPDKTPPAQLDAIVDELAAAEPPPESALEALAKARLEALRREFAARGADPRRLIAREGPVPVEASGTGRVEFEINA